MVRQTYYSKGLTRRCVSQKELRQPSAASGQGTGSREQGAGSREQGTGSREQGIGNREQGTGNREQGIGNSAAANSWRRCGSGLLIDHGMSMRRRREMIGKVGRDQGSWARNRKRTTYGEDGRLFRVAGDLTRAGTKRPRRRRTVFSAEDGAAVRNSTHWKIPPQMDQSRSDDFRIGDHPSGTRALTIID